MHGRWADERRYRRAITVSRTFDAPRERIFRAFTAPEQLARWWGRRDGRRRRARTNWRRVGGHGPDGTDGARRGHATIEVYSDAFTDTEGNIVEGMPVMLITTEFAESGGQTTVTSTTQFASDEDLQKVVAMGVAEGITQTWERLAAYLSSE